ncbi:sulfur carrier protein ThiS adenylyltransferase ThiF [Chitinispirillales bacterium ANBcel5]|uniref:sulfur carrier protein ThiS adenylyltransferase ThiF n=1 Tax=Cellulosispirillum alkaliphilum TaxID=3039283 RepID=UPI002A58B671|nr:sulfur carrier protein ThiS adenylyltransferase ThiF [Chitinispirillales bacterium ANBcel5]
MKYRYSDITKQFMNNEQQLKIKKCRVGIGGAGGLGSNCALILARCGFENFVVADYDRVELTNLNRQIYFPAHIGKYKVDCLKEILLTLNPEMAVQTHKVRVEMDNGAKIFGDCDIIVEAFDVPESKVMMFDSFSCSGKTLVTVSGLGGYGDSDRIQVRKIGDRIYIIGDEKSGLREDVKPFAPCVTIAAAKQADVVLSVVNGIDPLQKKNKTIG